MVRTPRRRESEAFGSLAGLADIHAGCVPSEVSPLGTRTNRGNSPRLWALPALLGLAGFLIPVSARADLQIDSKWRQGPLTEEFTVQQWLPGCGQEPQTARTGGGENVTLRAEGDELAIVGGGRVYRTNQCYDTMPSLARETHSRDANGKSWRTRCATPANDPRKAILNTLVVATSDTHVDLIETGRYEITLATGRCMADVKRTRSFDVATDDKPAPVPASTPAKEPKAEPRPATCENPGEPARLEVRPSRKLLRTGESFSFRAVVLDDKGCSTRTPTAWQLAPGVTVKGVTVDGTGKVTVAEGTPEGAFELVASAAGKSANVVVDVTEPAHYDELLARSGLNPSGENDAASVVTIASETIGAGASTVEDRARGRRLWFIAIIGAVLAALGVLAFALSRRAKQARLLEEEVAARHDARLRDALDRRQSLEREHAAQQRAHEASLAAARAAEEARARAAPAPERPTFPTLACPTCGRTWDDGTSFCPHDGVPLVARAAAALDKPIVAGSGAGPAAAPPKRGKICPTCGDRFDGSAEFCGKDGTQLVLIN